MGGGGIGKEKLAEKPFMPKLSVSIYFLGYLVPSGYG